LLGQQRGCEVRPLTDPKSLDSRNNLSERAPAPRYSPVAGLSGGTPTAHNSARLDQ